MYTGETEKRNSFQVAIISNGTESFVELLYPEREIQWIQRKTDETSLPDAKAQAGFIAEDGRVFPLRGSGSHQIRNIVSWSNIHEPGRYVFRIGVIGPNDTIAVPDQYNQSEVEIAEESKTCAQSGLSICHTDAKCVDYQAGICCQCNEGFYGNGKSCIKNNVPLRVHGKLNGVINDVNLNDVDIQSYVVVEDGRSYTALSLTPPALGSSLQFLNVLGSVVGWLFAQPSGVAKNGYQLTGSLFNYTADLWFPATGERVFINQEYLGHDVFDQITVDTEVRGTLPAVLTGIKLDISEYEEQYSISEPGTIRTDSTRTFTNKVTGQKYEQRVSQTISYNPCKYAPPSSDDSVPFTLKVTKNYLGYEVRENIVRYGSSNKIVPLGQEDPCVEGQKTCSKHSTCVVHEDSFSCVCNKGYSDIYVNFESVCIDIDECAAGTHNCDNNADCYNYDGGFECRCRDGFDGNGITCKKISRCQNLNCDANAQCIDNEGDVPFLASCVCNPGYTGDGLKCYPVYDYTCNRCSPDATCVLSEITNEYSCRCNSGFSGDGFSCVQNTPETTTPVSLEAEYNNSIVLPHCQENTCTCPPGYLYFRDEWNNELCKYEIYQDNNPPAIYNPPEYQPPDYQQSGNQAHEYNQPGNQAHEYNQPGNQAPEYTQSKYNQPSYQPEYQPHDYKQPTNLQPEYPSHELQQPEYPAPEQQPEYPPHEEQQSGYPLPEQQPEYTAHEEQQPEYPPHEEQQPEYPQPEYAPPEQQPEYSPPEQQPAYPSPEQQPAYPPPEQQPAYPPPEQQPENSPYEYQSSDSPSAFNSPTEGYSASNWADTTPRYNTDGIPQPLNPADYASTPRYTTPDNENFSENDASITCETDTDCPPNAVCSPDTAASPFTPYSGHCVCPEGYEGDAYECIERTGSTCSCGTYAHCTETPSNELICVCDAGYHGDGYTCRPNLSCSNNSDCELNAECRLDSVSNEYICQCIDGFVKDQNEACIPDAQLCNGALCAEHASCLFDSSIEISYCHCDSGFVGDGISQCVPAERTCDLANDCSLDAVCTLSESGYQCVCRDGFIGDGYTCTREVSCRTDPYLCSPHASCIQRSDSYICECNRGYNGNGTVCELNPRQDGNFIVTSDGTSIYRVPFVRSTRYYATPLNSGVSQVAVGVEVDCLSGRVYWGDVVSNNLKSVGYDGSSYEVFLSFGIKSPEGLAVDWSGRNIFWTDSKKLTIEVANLDTKVRKVLFAVNGIVNPRGIAVHPQRGKIFWSDWNRSGPKIEWANMDGTQRGIFLDSSDVKLPNSVAIDFVRERLCYADAGLQSIKCVGIDTLERETVAEHCRYPFGLAIHENKFYWSDWKSLTIEYIDTETKTRGHIDIPKSTKRIYGIAVAGSQCPSADNVCMHRNGGCDPGQLCLPNGQGGRSCVDGDKNYAEH
ncbi:hypothetical protein O3G_MSEX009239 [Manduca sexta]|nr:hypothetical protein O3G_MSEX009239 [Manduca sexta]